MQISVQFVKNLQWVSDYPTRKISDLNVERGTLLKPKIIECPSRLMGVGVGGLGPRKIEH